MAIIVNGESIPSKPRPAEGESFPRLLGGKTPWVSSEENALTTPAAWHKLIVCTDDCESCVLNTPEGCANGCFRFPDLVCDGCPCRASEFAGPIRKPNANQVFRLHHRRPEPKS